MIFGRRAWPATEAYRRPQPRFPPNKFCQSYSKMCHWQSEHEGGTCIIVLRHILDALCEMFSIPHIITDGLIEDNPLNDLQGH